MFFTNGISFLILFAEKKISKKVDARRKLVDLDSEEELAAAQNMTFHPDDPGKNIELQYSLVQKGGGGSWRLCMDCTSSIMVQVPLQL
jgi:hypothetical protein